MLVFFLWQMAIADLGINTVKYESNDHFGTTNIQFSWEGGYFIMWFYMTIINEEDGDWLGQKKS